MDDFERELRVGFLEEALQMLSDTEQCFLDLENNPNDPTILEKIFRLAHSLKGSAKAVGFEHLGKFTHVLESLLLKYKKGELKITSQAVSVLLRSNDHIGFIVNALREDMGANIDSSELIAELERNIAGEAEVVSTESTWQDLTPETKDQTTNPAPQPLTQSEAEEFARLDAAINGKPDPAVVAPSPAPVVDAPKETKKPAAAPSGQPDESIRVSLARLEKLLNFVGEIVILQTVLKEQVISSPNLSVKKTVHLMGKVTKEVQDLAMSLRMVPLKQTFQKMQRIVRDTAGLLNKKVHLELRGEDTELDKTILEAISDPLVHMIRNAVDHGIESPEKRVLSGKSEQGTVTLEAYHQSGKLIIEVRDDGGGIPADVLRRKAVEKGILKPNAQISDQEAINLIFHPGFSTKAEVTEVSGRGVGMDVVKTNIEAIGGEVVIESTVGKGSRFKVTLPLTLAIIDGMIVKSENDKYVIPLVHVHETVRLGENDVKTLTGVGEVLLLRGENLPLFRLGNLLGRKPGLKKATENIAIVVRATGQPFAVMVDDIIGQYQIVIKKLGSEMAHIKGFAGSAILGDGKPSLILELAELISGGSGKSSSDSRRMVA